MVAVENILQNKFGSSKNLPTFVASSPKTLISIFAVAAIFYAPYSAQAGIYGYQIPANCCTVKSVIVFGETGGDSLSYIHISNFHSQMPKTMKNLTQTPKVCSVSTSNARKSVTSKSVTITPNLLYQITMKLTVSSDGADGRVRRCGVIHTDIYQAASENEAMGLALTTVRRKYGAFYDIDLHSITRERTYRAIQQQSQQPQHPWQR